MVSSGSRRPEKKKGVGNTEDGCERSLSGGRGMIKNLLSVIKSVPLRENLLRRGVRHKIERGAG